MAIRCSLGTKGKKGTNPKVDAQFLTHGEVFLAAPIRGGAGEVLARRGRRLLVSR